MAPINRYPLTLVWYRCTSFYHSSSLSAVLSHLVADITNAWRKKPGTTSEVFGLLLTYQPKGQFSCPRAGNHCSSITAMKVGSSTSIGITKLVSDLVLWLELHKSSLHVHTVASPSCMHFSAPCIQQARNRTTVNRKKKKM